MSTATTTTVASLGTYYALISNVLELYSISTTKIDPNVVFNSLISPVSLNEVLSVYNRTSPH